MWLSYQEMYMNIDNEKLLIEKRLKMVRFANENGIKKVTIQTDNDLENTNRFLKTRGYSPLNKIKETYEIDDIIYPMPQILSV